MDALRALLQAKVDAKIIPGAIAVVGAEDPELIMIGASAFDGAAITADTIFRIQSMTKIVTCVALLRCVERGQIGLDDAVDNWLPVLADRHVLVHPEAALDQTVPAVGPITVRHLMTGMSGYGISVSDSPLRKAMVANGTEASAESLTLGATDWLAALAELPLAFQPGEGWRYHHSYGLLGILLGRVAGVSTAEALAADVFEPLGLVDTGFVVPPAQAHRLPPAYRHIVDGPIEVEPAAGGAYVGPPLFDLSHGELVSTAADFHRFLRALARGELITDESLASLSTDQVPQAAKTDDSFYPGFWNQTGWGFGVSVDTDGPHQGRYGWSGGFGTNFFIDPDGSIAVLLTQVEIDDQIGRLLAEFGDAVPTRR